VERTFDPLPVDDPVAPASRRSWPALGTRRHPRVVDALIAATAVAHDLPIYSQDRDFALMPGVDLISV
jgi:predicted nucleic acid-binding protein